MSKRKWEFEAFDGDGQLQSDIVIAENYKEVIAICIKRGLYPRDIRELSKQAAANYGQLPKLKELKQKLENPPKQKSQFSPMMFNIDDEPELPQTRSSIQIDWVYLGFILLVVLLILGSAVHQQ